MNHTKEPKQHIMINVIEATTPLSLALRQTQLLETEKLGQHYLTNI